MEIAAFDTHGFVKRLTGAGMPEAQSRLIQERLATKQDLEKLKADLKRDFKELEYRFKRDMQKLEQKLIIKLGAIMVIGVTVLAALIKLL